MGAHPSQLALAAKASNSTGPMRFVDENSTVPAWLAMSYLISNLTLNSLNFYWFVMMIKAVTKRFKPAKQPIQEKPNVSISSSSSSQVVQGGVSRRSK
jgi:hypothetical protein